MQTNRAPALFPTKSTRWSMACSAARAQAAGWRALGEHLCGSSAGPTRRPQGAPGSRSKRCKHTPAPAPRLPFPGPACRPPTWSAIKASSGGEQVLSSFSRTCTPWLHSTGVGSGRRSRHVCCSARGLGQPRRLCLVLRQLSATRRSSLKRACRAYLPPAQPARTRWWPGCGTEPARSAL